jgi:Phosphoribosyl transferase domain
MLRDEHIGEIIVQADELQHRIKEMAAEVSRDYAGKDLLLIGVLKGAVFFLADLMRHLDMHCEVDFMAVASYGSSTESSGVVRILKDLDAPLEGRCNTSCARWRPAGRPRSRSAHFSRSPNGARSRLRRATLGSRFLTSSRSDTGSTTPSATGICRMSRP